MTIIEWANKIDWEKRVKAVCKPCWELKYCPYGILVEDFPLKEERDIYSCRVFGHDCPVFSVAEPFTETRDLRKVSRSIPSVVKRKVLFRDKQVCQNCRVNIDDFEVHFDHVIPWSKGGSSDESNIQLLCKECNNSKSNKFERDNLIYSITEHTRKSVPLDFILVFKDCFEEKYRIEREEKRSFVIDDLLNVLEQDEINKPIQHAFRTVNEIEEFFVGEKPVELSKKLFKALERRWGIKTKIILSIEKAAMKTDVFVKELILVECDLFRRLGMTIEINSSNRKKWEKI